MTLRSPRSSRHLRAGTARLVATLCIMTCLPFAGAAHGLHSAGELLWVQEARLAAADGTNNDQFGSAVALWGDTALVGTTTDDNGRGAVYVFTRSDGVWSEQVKLTASDGMELDRFGVSVALVGDTALVGASGVNGDQGAAYVFTRDGDTWSEQAKLTASDGVASDNFGQSVALSGGTALVGAHTVDVEGNMNQGAAYVFVGDGAAWSEQARLAASDGEPIDQFGYAVALSGDTALAGARFGNVDGNTSQGAAYLFVRSGATWTFQAKVTASDGVAFDNFGESVALAGDTALVGARQADPDGSDNQGAAYVFIRSDEMWSEEERLTASDGAQFNQFGSSVAVAEETALIGARAANVDGNSSQGAAYVFVRSEEGWSEEAKLTASDGEAFDNFGAAAALSAGSALLGAPVGVFPPSPGAAYVFIELELPPDFATLEGTVQSLGYCHDEIVALVGATVEIAGAENDYTVETANGGFYQIFLPESESPLSLTVAAPGHLPATVEGVELSGGEVVVRDFDPILDAPCATVAPEEVALDLPAGAGEVFELIIGNGDGGAPLDWTLETAVPPAGASREPAGPTVTPRSAPGVGGDAEGAIDLLSLRDAPLPGGRPIQLASGVVDCDGEPGLIVHDNGTVHNGFSGDPFLINEVVFVDRFTPGSYPRHFRAVCLAYLTAGPTSLDFEIVAFDDGGSNGSPGAELGALPASATGIPGTTGTPVWFSYDISSLGLSIDSGSVHIGVRWAPSDPNVFIAADESTPPGFAGGYWWRDDTGDWTPMGIPGSFMNYHSLFVRAVENLGGCHDPADLPWLSVAADAGSTPAGASTSVEITVDTSGLEAGEHRASLCLSTSDSRNPLIVVPVTLTVSPSEITLAAEGYKVRGFHAVDLSWDGASSAEIDVWRDGMLIVTVSNDGEHTDSTGRKGRATYIYQVCEAGRSVCSNEVTVRFGGGGQ